MARIALSRVPVAGRDLEDYVAGLFQAAGYFVEKNIRQRDVEEVLELDAVATSYAGLLPTSVLAEAKGGRWGFPDLFKVAGWMRYLGIARGGFFVKDHPTAAPRDVSRIHRKIAPLGVSLVDFGDFSDPGARFGEGGFGVPGSQTSSHDGGSRPQAPGTFDPLLLEVWRYSYWAERALLERLREARRASPERRGPQEVLAYHDLVNDHVFFLHDAAERLRRLYDAYKAHPKLSAAVAGEIGGAAYAEVARPRRRGPLGDIRPLAEAMYEGEHPSVQAAFYVEHRARLTILKAAIDLCCLAASGGLADRAAARATLGALPASFREGLRALRARPSFRRYALVWQVFLWGFGGFYLADREDEELGRLSHQTGVPRDEVADALRAFDDLFPLAGGSWIVPVKNTPIRLARMMPFAFRGVGALQRLRWRDAPNYDGFGVGHVARRHLISWHNGLVRLLAGEAPAAARG
jgi:hypothetical protein